MRDPTDDLQWNWMDWSIYPHKFKQIRILWQLLFMTLGKLIHPGFHRFCTGEFDRPTAKIPEIDPVIILPGANRFPPLKSSSCNVTTTFKFEWIKQIIARYCWFERRIDRPDRLQQQNAVSREDPRNGSKHETVQWNRWKPTRIYYNTQIIMFLHKLFHRCLSRYFCDLSPLVISGAKWRIYMTLWIVGFAERGPKHGWINEVGIKAPKYHW